jgi:predicted PurR-regulated permease PerM
VTDDRPDPAGRDQLTTTFVELAIRIAALGLVLYWTLILLLPFLTIGIWSAVLTVALYPAFEWLARRLGGRRRLAAVLITILSLLVVIGPATWLALDLVESLRMISDRIDLSTLALPAPPASVKDWPLIGDPIYQFWNLASTNLAEALAKLVPQLKPVGTVLLGIAADAGTGILKFFAAIIVAGFLFAPAPSIIGAVKKFLRRLVPERGEEFANLAGATIRAVSRGVIGISVLQALLAGIGLMMAGVPAASVITSAVLIFGIIQIGPAIILVVHGLHGAGEFVGQRSQAHRDGPGIEDPHAGHIDRPARRDARLRNHRTFPRPDRVGGDLGALGRLDKRGRSVVDRRGRDKDGNKRRRLRTPLSGATIRAGYRVS